jgi:DNA-binding transcriptional ArsR family regulator
MFRSTESTAAGYFREVARPGSSRADANLFVSPSAISRQIRLLEEDLGVEVFARRRGDWLSQVRANCSPTSPRKPLDTTLQYSFVGTMES